MEHVLKQVDWQFVAHAELQYPEHPDEQPPQLPEQLPEQVLEHPAQLELQP